MNSNGQIFVGIFLETNIYIGSRISAINLGLKFIQKINSHDNITSTKINNTKISKNRYNQKITTSIIKSYKINKHF